MTTDEKNLILARLEKLERQNRTLKRCALICVLALATIGVTGMLMGQTQTKKTTKPKPAPAAPAAPVVPEKLEAESFILKDAAGHERAELAMGGTGPSFRLLDQTGTALVTIGLNDGSPAGPLMLLSDPNHHGALAISVQQGAQLSLRGDQNAMVHMGVTKDGTMLELFDQDGFSTSIGNGVKVAKSGKAQDTSAASIALYNKDRKLLWSAP